MCQKITNSSISCFDKCWDFPGLRVTSDSWILWLKEVVGYPCVNPTAIDGLFYNFVGVPEFLQSFSFSFNSLQRNSVPILPPTKLPTQGTTYRLPAWKEYPSNHKDETPSLRICYHALRSDAAPSAGFR